MLAGTLHTCQQQTEEQIAMKFKTSRGCSEKTFLHDREPDMKVVLGRVLWELTSTYKFMQPQMLQKAEYEGTIQESVQRQSKKKLDLCAQQCRKKCHVSFTPDQYERERVGVMWRKGWLPAKEQGQ